MPKTEDDWVVAKVVETVEEARFAAGFLASHEIRAEVESLRVDELPVNVGSLAVVRVLVPRTQLAEATELLADQQSAPAGLDEAALAAGSSEEEPRKR
jgi:hypothetical protein